MAEQSGFFDAHLTGGTYDRVYLASSFARYFASFIGNGVFADKAAGLMVYQTNPSAMGVKVFPGQAWINGYWYENDSEFSLPIDIADGVLNRIDLVVLRWGTVERSINLVVKKGTPASNAVAPVVQRDSDYYELKLAEIHVTAGSTSITQANIVDTRADTNTCGWVTGVIKQVDTAELFAQWQAAYEAAYAETQTYHAEQKAAWERFFANTTEDSVFPVPALEDVGKVPVVNATADGYELKEFLSLLGGTMKGDVAMGGHKVTGLGNPEEDGDAVPLKYVRKAAPVNLLDNSDFRNPINQRGENTYTDTSALTIDRWRKRGTAAQCEVVVESGGVRIKRIASEGYTGIMQVLEFDEARFGGKTLTFAVKLKECGTRTCIRLISSNNGNNNRGPIGEAFVDTVGIHTVTATIPLDLEDPYFGVAIVPGTIDATSSLGAAGEVVVEWCALYEGEYTAETLPEYKPKGYAAELMECRRYFYNMALATKAGVLTGAKKNLRFGIPLPVIMRLTNPTVTEVSVTGLRTDVGSIDPPTINTVTATIYKDGWLDLLLEVEAISAATNNTPVAAYVGAVISADL